MKSLLTALIVVLSLTTANAQDFVPGEYEHIFIVTRNADLEEVFTSVDGKEYSRVQMHKQVEGPWDFNPIITIIHQYERDGWVLMSVPQGGIDGKNMFWLRRLKN